MDDLEQLIRGGQATAKKDYSNLITDDLLDRLRKVESGKDNFAVNKQTKALGAYQFMPETVADFHRRGIEFNPFNEKEARQVAKKYLTDLVNKNGGDLDKALASYGGFVTKDPSQYVGKVKGEASQPVDDLEQLIRGTAKETPAPTKPQGVSQEDMSKPFIGYPSAKKPTATTPSEANTQPMRELGQGLASLADTTLGGIVPSVAGPVTYAGARAMGKTPEQASALEQQVVGATEKPFGKMFGVTETPGYQQEASRKIMDFIGQNIGKGAEWIASKTGLPVADVQNMMGTVMAGGAPTALKVAGKVPEVVKPVIGTIQEARELVQPQQAFKKAAEQPKGGMVSMGSAAAPTETTIKAALTQASPELQQAIGNIPVNKVNMPVLQRHIEADTLPVPIRLTEGQATGDPIIISQEMNRRGKPGNEALVARLNEQNQQLVDNLNAIREKAAPDAFGTRPIEFGDSIIEAYKAKNKVLEQDINAKYTALRDAAGGQFPVDAPQLLKNVENTLRKDLLTNDAKQISQFKELQRLAKENSMTFEDFLSLRKNLGNVARTAQDGNVRMAASRMIDELEKLPLSKAASNLKPLADEARKAARERFQMLSKDPAFKAAVEDTVPADKFAQKFVINGVNKNVRQMIENLGSDSPAHQNMKAAVLNHLKEKAGIIDDKGNFTQAGYNKALRNLDNMNNLNIIMDGETAGQLKNLGNVAGYIQNQPKGSFVNNSNSAVAFLADKAASALETAGNVALGGKFGIPAGSIVRGKVQEFKAKKEAEKSLRPGAGVELRNIGKEEK